MKIAVLTDVHGNDAALAAVLEDIARIGVDSIYCAGDLVGLGPKPNEVVARMREAAIPTVMGNHEVELLAELRGDRSSGKDHIAWTAKVLRKKHRRYLKGLPFHLEIDLDGLTMLLLHGSPRGVYDYVFPSLTTRSLGALFPEGAARPDVLVAGHTHMPFVRRVGGMLVVNAGTVGKSMDGDPRGSWALIQVTEGRATARILRTEYPVDETLAAMKKAKMRKGLIKALRASMRRWPPRKVGRLW